MSAATTENPENILPQDLQQASKVNARKIVHIDMDAFFASVEQRDNPALQGKPVAVGYGAARGVVAAASYEARQFGVHSAMPSVTARRKCPELIFVPPRFDVYRAVSQQLHSIFAQYTSLIEPLSLDEAYLDVTERASQGATATAIAEEIRGRIKETTGLTASAGISYNKFLAKIASGRNKPNGQFVITPKSGPAFVETLPIQKFHGVGPATAGRMHGLDIQTGADLKSRSLAFLQGHFGKAGSYYFWIARGIDERPVRADRIRKSVGAEDTFATDLFDIEVAQFELRPLIEKVWGYCEARSIRAKTVTLKVKYANYQQITRSRTVTAGFARRAEFEAVASTLLGGVFPVSKGVRLLGVTLSNLAAEIPGADQQLSLID